MKSACSLAKTILGFIKDPDIIKPLIATMLGVFLAFMLNDYWHKINSDKVTKDRLHLVCLEVGYNADLLKEALKAYSYPEIKEIFIRRVSYSLAMSAANDNNIVTVLPKHKISLLMSYIESLRTVNLSLEQHQAFSFITKTKSFKNSNDMMQAIKSNTASAIASCALIRRELEDYFDKESYEKEKLNEYRKELMDLKNNLLQQEQIKS